MKKPNRIKELNAKELNYGLTEDEEHELNILEAKQNIRFCIIQGVVGCCSILFSITAIVLLLLN